MKKINFIQLFTVLVATVFALSACNDQTELTDELTGTNPQPRTTQAITYCGTPKVVDFMAGQNILSGAITVGNDANNLYITYTTTGGWLLKQTHLYVGACEAIPLNKSLNPVIGQFPYKAAHLPYVTSYQYVIPLAQLPSCMCVAAHAEVVKLDGAGNIIQGETAWGKGVDMGGKSWAMKFDYCKQTCVVTPPTPRSYQTETAWVSGTRYTQQGNWATYTTYTGNAMILPIYGGQTINVGSASLSSVANGIVTLNISLNGGWELNAVSEPVKIQGYTSPPSGNPSPGTFTTYKGTNLTVQLPYYNYYGIHLDVRKPIY